MTLENLNIQAQTEQAPKAITLASLIDAVSSRVKSIPATWVIAEIAQIKQQRHLYLELVEHDANQQEVAKCRAAVWANQLPGIMRRFEDATGGPIKAGMKLMLYGKPSFHAQYGFTLNIENIDPAYTLGDMQKKINDIREKLIAEGLFGLNKRMQSPQDFTNVAVVAPSEAAGLGDFMATVAWLEKYGLCKFSYFNATFQGLSTNQSVVAALSKVVDLHKQNSFDALVIIRGGGAVTDLAYLNEYEIASYVTKMQLPVLTGIGHQKDSCILDEVANMRFDTPSKVASHIMDTITNNALQAQQNWSLVWNYWEKSKQDALISITSIEESIRSRAVATIANSRAEADLMLQSVQHMAGNLLDTAVQKTAILKADVETISLRLVATASTNCKNAMEFVMGMGPQATLRRGFAVARSEGKFITSAGQVKAVSEIELEFYDGKINLKTKGQL